MNLLHLHLAHWRPMKSTIAIPRLISKVMIFAILCGFAFQPTLGLAKVYKYKDDQGKIHFTDDPSQIPLKYRKKNKMEKFREVFEPNSSGKSSSSFGATGTQKGTGGATAGKAGAGDEDEGFSEKDEASAKKTIQVFKDGVALANRYKGAYPNFANVRGLIDAMQSALPQKESLAKELTGTKVPELQDSLAFLNQSIAEDKKNKSTGTALKKAIVGIFSRVASDAQKQTALIEKIEKAMKESEKKKEEAKKKKESEKKKVGKAGEAKPRSGPGGPGGPGGM